MKFTLNGALTIGTDDGANVEIRELVGDDNFFLFGLTEPEVSELVDRGYHPSAYYETNRTCATRWTSSRRARSRAATGAMFEPIVSNLLHEDRFLALADFQAYVDAQARVDKAYADTDAWTRSRGAQRGARRVLLLRPVDARLHRPDLAHVPRRARDREPPSAEAVARVAASSARVLRGPTVGG